MPGVFRGDPRAQNTRWAPAVRLGQLAAIRCLGCRKTMLFVGDTRRIQCGRCGSRSVMMLSPKGTVLRAGTLRAFGLA